ncbi:hypothetical protein GCM10008959_36510 [Deinococcus seoulensis]|uniref:Tn3 family transposase n=1 Tax=Deinococcus seoulensis TaxID=1837379 RepID=A0ABQ2RZ31_9DEIO|nr:hypothetical protein GCM10008959_36510 [Deinococcus seoulensis]
MRFLGTFLLNPLDVPPNVLRFVARQLGVQAKQVKLDRYRQGETKWDHQRDIGQTYGYRVFSEPAVWIGLIRFLMARTHLQAESPSLLLDRATARLYEHNIILPGVTTLSRLIARVQERSETQLCDRLVALLSPEQRERLVTLLSVPERAKVSSFEQLRQAPISISAQGLVGALKRVERIRQVGVRTVNLRSFPTQRLDTLSRIGLGSKTQTLRRLTSSRQLAVLLVTVSRLEASALDDALTVLDSLLTDVFNRIERQDTEQKLASLPSLEEAARSQNQLTRLFLEHLKTEQHDFDAFSQQVLTLVSKDVLERTVQAIAELTQPTADRHIEQLLARYSYVQQFVPTLLHTVGFEANRSGQPLLAAINALRTLERRKKDLSSLPTDWITGRWGKHLRSAAGEVQRSAYTLGVLEQLHLSLKRRDLYVPASDKFNDPRLRLLSGPRWADLKVEVCRSLDLDPDPAVVLARLERQLDETYHLLAERLPENASASIEEVDGKSRLVLQLDEAQDEPPSLRQLHKDVAARLPRIDLPDLLLEVHRWTGFADEFQHLSERRSRVEHLPMSVCAVLLSEACNVSLDAVVQPEREALRSSRLSWVSQNYVRAETIAAANARLVNFQSTLPDLPAWGQGYVASVDGLRFRVPVKSIYSGQNPKYFGVGSGVTYVNFVADQFTSFHGIVVPGTLRDSPLDMPTLKGKRSKADIKAQTWHCKFCGVPMTPRMGPLRAWYFAHQRDASACPFEVESEKESPRHQELKHAAAEALRRHFKDDVASVEYEVRFPHLRRIADAVITLKDGARVAVEAQLSPLTLDLLQERTNSYVRDDIEIVWVFEERAEGDLKPGGLWDACRAWLLEEGHVVLTARFTAQQSALPLP